MADPTIELMEALNQRCRCIGLDSDLLAERLDRDEPKLFETILADKPHMFAAFPVFIPRAHVSAMQRVVSAIEDVAALPAYRAHVLKGRPEIARVDHGPTGVFYGHDFHLGAAGPQLIEINTNAGGAMLNVALAEAQRACCSEVEAFVNGPHDVAALEQTFVDMFRAEYRAQRGDAPLRRIAIVDLEPEKQYLYPDFRLVQRMLARAGIDTVLADPTALRLTGDGLVHERGPVDLVYNRLTDFYLEDHEQLREAYVRGTTVVTPNPHGYALHADKRNLVVLSDPELLAELGVPTELREVLAAGIPRTIRVTRANADELWSRRKQLFFKPTTGFGGRATYRGAKLTRKTWDAILAADYVAQREVPPSQRTIELDGAAVPLKLDVRGFVFRGAIQLMAARLYRGQTTNFRTPGGGFAPVYTEST